MDISYISKLIGYYRTIMLIADQIIFKLKGNLIGGNESLETKSDNILPPIPQDVKDKENILLVIDDNNYYQSMRYEYYQLARKHTVGFCQIYLKPNCIDNLLSNNRKRPEKERIPDEVIKKMDSKIEPPNPFANLWEQFSFSISVGDDIGNKSDHNLFNMETCLDVVNAALDNPVQPLPPTPPDKTEEAKSKARNICSTNVYHRADKILRYVLRLRTSKKGNDHRYKIGDIFIHFIQTPCTEILPQFQILKTILFHLFIRKMLNTQMREAMKNDESDMTQLGQRLNTARTKLLQDLKTSINECIPSEVISAVTEEQDIGQENMRKANEDLERIIGELFELKLKTGENA